ncbi:MAG: hypothetical protein SYNGOMJ08_00494 [Candidatus Syntrophoarchaeum sp. GoM_oil]|nr:MAG: hypothetical protein SYNGOMJ08_00494 [Candidatus Syntrophoarchaeum sp. GoM_oil]
MTEKSLRIFLLALVCLTGITLAVAQPAVEMISYYPSETDITDFEGAARTFNVTINQTVNVSWLINETEVLNKPNVNFSEYTNESAIRGYWNVTAYAYNENGGSDAHTWRWTVNVSDTTPPEIVDNAPDGTKESVKTDITATFSEAMNQSTLNAATIIVCNSSGSSVTGVINYNNSTNIVTFNPVSWLEYNEVYNVTITTGVEDLAGNNISSNFSWDFTTRSEVMIIPIVIYGYVTKNGTKVLNPVVTITNLDTGKDFAVETHPNSSYYRTLTDSTHVRIDDTLRFDVNYGDIVVSRTITEADTEKGGFRQDLPDMPDLVITNYTEEWVDPVHKTSFNITFTVKNTGSKDAPESIASTYIEYLDGISMKSYTIELLAPGENKIITVDHISCPCRDIRICADSNNAVLEFDETNNCMETRSKCALPDLKVQKYIREDILQPHHDFIEIIDEANGRYKIYYAIKNWNLGRAGADAGQSNATINITALIDGSIVSTDIINHSIPRLPHKSHSSNISETFTCSPGTEVSVKVCADSDNGILESNENNNCKEESFNCTAIDKPDLKITDSSATWVDFVNKTFIVDYTVENIGHKCANESTTYVHGENDPVPALEPGENHTSTRGPFNLSGLQTAITICADTNNLINESNEDNNCRNTSIGQASMYIHTPFRQLRWIDPNPLIKTYRIWFWVANRGGADSGKCTVYAYTDGSDNPSATCNITNVDPTGAGWKEKDIASIGPITMTGKNDTIKLCIEWEDGNKRRCSPSGVFNYEGCLADDYSTLYSCSGDKLVKKSCTFIEGTSCGGDGLLIGAANITIDGNGYAIIGTSSCEGNEWDSCASTGINRMGTLYDNVTIKNLEVSNYCNGIAIRNVNNYRIENCSVHDNGPSGGTNKYTYGINVRNSNHIMIDNCSVYNNTGILTGMNVAGGHGINFDDGSDYCEVTNSHIYYNYHSGILASPTCKYLYIGNNLIEDNGYYNDSKFCTGINLHWKGGFGLTTNSTVESNTILNNTGYGIYVAQSGATLKDNVIKACADGTNVTGDGIRIESEKSTKLTFLYNNTICKNEGVDIVNQGFATYGDENTCDTTSDYDDDKSIGCSFYCGGVNGVCVWGDIGAGEYFECGDTVDKSCTFNRSMSCRGCDDGDGLIVDANNITINGAGYKLIGNYSGVGILSNHSGVTIKNLQVEDFSTGIKIENGSENAIENCTICRNRGGQTETGINFSANNGTLLNNSIYDNVGPGLFIGGSNNTFENNTIARNDGYGIYFSINATNNNITANAVGDNRYEDIYNGNGMRNLTGDNNTCDIAYNYLDYGMTEYNCTYPWTPPDLVISEKSEHWVDKDAKTYEINYTIANIAEPYSRPAGPSTTWLSIDRYHVGVADDRVSSLAQGDNEKRRFDYTAKMSGPSDAIEVSDDIEVYADGDDEIVENNEADIFYYKDDAWYSVKELCEDKEANNYLKNTFREGDDDDDGGGPPSPPTTNPNAACVAEDGTAYRCSDPYFNTVTESCTFNDSMECPAGSPGLIIGASGITIDGARFGLYGNTTPADCEWADETTPCKVSGIYNDGYDDVTIKNFKNSEDPEIGIVGFCTGIALYGEADDPVRDNTIENCNIYENGFDTPSGGSAMKTHGIHLCHVSGTTIKDNDIYLNHGTGEACDGGGNGIFLYAGRKDYKNNEITKNHLHDNDKAGLWIKFQPHDVLIADNDVWGNGYGTGITDTVRGGIVLRCKDSSWNTIEGNTMRDNNGDGIYIGGNENTLTDNTVEYNTEDGIDMGRGDGSDNNTLSKNAVCDNGEFDIRTCGTDCSGNTGPDNCCNTTKNYHDKGKEEGEEGCTWHCPCGEKPDLTITKLHADWIFGGPTYAITYTIENIGDADAPASTTHIWIDGKNTPDQVPAISAQGSYPSDCRITFRLSGDEDEITVRANGEGAFRERDPDNNEMTISFPPHLESIVVSPSDVSVPFGGTLEFGATAYDQNGEWMPGVNIFDWSCDPLFVGWIDNGRFTAGRIGGIATINASASYDDYSAEGKATVTVFKPTETESKNTIGGSPSNFSLYDMLHPDPGEGDGNETGEGGKNVMNMTNSTDSGTHTVSVNSIDKGGIMTVIEEIPMRHLLSTMVLTILIVGALFYLGYYKEKRMHRRKK